MNADAMMISGWKPVQAKWLGLEEAGWNHNPAKVSVECYYYFISIIIITIISQITH